MSTRALLPVAAVLAFAASPAMAELQPSVRAMIDAAIASGNEQTATAVIAVARQTNPDDAAEIDEIETAYKAQLAAAREAKVEAEQVAIRTAGPFDMWKGRGEVGAFRSTGNTDNLDVTSLSSLFAGNVAATGGVAKLLAEKEFSGQFHEGEKTNIHLSIVA